jgi:ATP-binding cassette subfamily C protein
LDLYDPTERGRLIGYLPQRVAFLDGTVAENIARFDPLAMDDQIIRAAMRADAHSMILDLPLGYDTPLIAAAPALSGGQMQRIGLARALFGDPVLLVLDEPNSALDAEGANALNAAIRQHKSTGGTAIITSHRPAALQECDLVLVLDVGVQTAFGPRDAVLQRQVSNHATLQHMIRSG